MSGDTLGVSKTAAYNLVTRAFKQSVKKMEMDIQMDVKLDIERVDACLMNTMTQAKTGNSQSSMTLLRLLDHRRYSGHQKGYIA